MEEMKQEIGDSDPELLQIINDPINKMYARGMRSSGDMWGAMIYRPEPFDVPRSLKHIIDRSYVAMNQGDPVMFQIDLDDDGQNEYLLLMLHKYGIGNSQFYHLTENGWQAGNVIHAAWNHDDAVPDLIRKGEIELVDPHFKHLEVGGVLLKPFTRQ
jgi:hypothetical protein